MLEATRARRLRYMPHAPSSSFASPHVCTMMGDRCRHGQQLWVLKGTFDPVLARVDLFGHMDRASASVRRASV